MAAADPPLAIIVMSGAFDRVHYALAVAAAALAIGRPVSLFFAMGATRALLAPDGGRPGWHELLATEDGRSPAAAEADLLARGLGGFEALLDACAALGGRFMVCEMGLKAKDLAGRALRPDIAVAPGGLATFLGELPGGTAPMMV